MIVKKKKELKKILAAALVLTLLGAVPGTGALTAMTKAHAAAGIATPGNISREESGRSRKSRVREEDPEETGLMKATPGNAERDEDLSYEEPASWGNYISEDGYVVSPAEELVVSPAEAEYPAFEMSETIDGIRITVTAEEGAFPADAVLVVERVPVVRAAQAEEAVSEQRPEGQNVAVSYTFDIRVEDQEGKELQPANGSRVNVAFAAALVADSNLETNVYHITEEGSGEKAAEGLPESEAGPSEGTGSSFGEGIETAPDASSDTYGQSGPEGSLTAEKLEVELDEAGETAVVETDGFSLYTVEFTYNSLQYVMPGGTYVPLADVLDTVGLSGTASAVEVSDSTLFSASDESGEWVITSHQPFGSTEWMKVTIGGIVYEITVTDATTVTTWSGLKEALGNGGEITLGNDITISQQESSDGKYLFVVGGKTAVLDLNGKTLTGGGSNAVITVNSGGKLTIKDSSEKTGKITGADRYGAGGALEVRGECTLQSGTLSGNKAYNGGGVQVYGKFTMNGGTISNNSGAKNNDYSGDGGGVCVSDGGTFIMNNGTITGNDCGSGQDGGGVAVESGGSFTMNNGTISNNQAPGSVAWGGGVCNKGTFTMNGGSITGNVSEGSGGGVLVASDATFTMSGGTISNNHADRSTSFGSEGGGVYLAGSFTMSGGTISGNIAGTHGGGIDMGSGADFTMSGGSITGNTAGYSGGGIGSNGTFTMTGGSVTNNTCSTIGGGINTGGTFNLRGNVTISGNKCGSTDDNLALRGPAINITGALTNSTPIGVNTQTAPTVEVARLLTKGLSGNGTIGQFKSDSERYYVDECEYNGSTEAALYAKYKVTVETESYYSHISIPSESSIQYVMPDSTMTSVVCTANSGYCFPAGYSVETVNGVKVTRNSATQITVSGKPTGDATIKLPSAVRQYTVTITPGSHMTKTGSSGAASQTGAVNADAIKDVVYNADSGYYFPDTYASVGTTYGVTVTRNSAKQITVSGTPTTESVNISLAAPSRKTVKITGGITASDKVYDGNTTATLNCSGAVISGIVPGDTVTLASATGTFNNKNVGTNKTVTISGLTLGGTNGSEYAIASSGNQTSTTASITKKSVTVSGITASNKVYDGNTTAAMNTSGASFSGIVSGDNLTVSCTGTFNNKNVGTNKTVTISGMTLGGSSVGNYQLASSGNQASTKANITKKPVTVTGGITASDKVYDGGTAATLVTTNASFSGKLSSDTLSVSGTGTFADKKVGSGKTVTISGLTLGGTSAGNYQLASSGNQGSTTASITKKTVAVTGGITAADKVYDGNTTATLDTTGASIPDKVSGDNLTVSATGTFDTANAGSGKTVTISNLALEGTDAGNYALAATGNQASTTASITAKEVTVSGITAEDKIYDGSTEAILVTGSATFAGIESGDTLTVSGAGTFADKKVGSGKTVTISGLTLGGSSVGNYQLAASGHQGSTTASITKKTVAVTGGITAADKVYDGNTTATLDTTGASIPDMVSGDNLTVSATGTFDNASAGSGKTVTISDLALGGTDAGNYALASSGNQETATASITAKEVTVSGITAEDKVYDGSTAAALDCSGAIFDGIVGSDELTVSGTGTFDDANAGSGKTVTISDLTLGGADAGQYTLDTSGSQESTTASVTEKEAGLSWGETAFTYNGLAQVPEATATGLVDGDSCDVTVTGAGTDAGSYTATASGLSNSNYKLPSEVTKEFTIGPKEVGLSWGETAFTYNGLAHVPEATATGLVDGDSCDVTVTGAGTDAGSYTATASALSNSNYKLPAEGTKDYTIGRAALSVTTPDAEKVYDGTPLSAAGSITGLVNSETATLAAAGTQTKAGSSTNAYSISWDGTAAEANYEIASETLGTLTVTPKEVTVSGITAASKRYDRSAAAVLNYDSVVISGMIAGDDLSVRATGTFEDEKAGRDKNVNITGITLTGKDAANYKLAASGNQSSTTADITRISSGGSSGTTTVKGYVGSVGGTWNQDGSNWSYTYLDGHRAEGWNYLYYNGRSDWYYFDGAGLMQTGWIDWEENRYYLNPVSDGRKGALLTGWQLIDGNWYYFEPVRGRNQGRMYRNESTPDGYTLGPDGAWTGSSGARE